MMQMRALASTPYRLPPRHGSGAKDETLRVICVRWGDKFGDNYVNALRAGVERNLTIPHTFECAHMELGLPGFWNKLGLFRPGFITGPTLYLDLDVVVMGNLDWALEAAKAAPISMPWVHGKYDTYTPHAAVMTFSGADVSKAWPPSDALMESFQDDERYLPVEFADVIGRLPEGKVISYKWGVLLRDEAKGASLVSFHGFPKPHQITGEPLLTRHWDVLR